MRYSIVVQRKDKVLKTFGPPPLEVDILRLGDQERRLVGLSAKWNYERVVLEATGDIRCNLDFVSYALLFDRDWVGNKENLAGTVSQSGF